MVRSGDGAGSDERDAERPRPPGEAADPRHASGPREWRGPYQRTHERDRTHERAHERARDPTPRADERPHERERLYERPGREAVSFRERPSGVAAISHPVPRRRPPRRSVPHPRPEQWEHVRDRRLLRRVDARRPPRDGLCAAGRDRPHVRRGSNVR